jgi:hypothetical protein
MAAELGGSIPIRQTAMGEPKGEIRNERLEIKALKPAASVMLAADGNRTGCEWSPTVERIVVFHRMVSGDLGGRCGIATNFDQKVARIDGWSVRNECEVVRVE